MLSLKQIHYALAVEKTLHFKKAAAQCAVSQSALSTALSELEKQLGIQVFERDNKRVLVTPMGKAFLAHAKRIKQQVDDLHQSIQSQKGPLSFPMSIGAIPTISPYLFPKVLPTLRQKHPDFKLHIVEEQSLVLVNMVKEGELDAAILAMPYPLDGLLSFDFWEEDFYLVAHHDHQINTNQIKASQINENELMLLKDGHCLKDHALDACKLKSQVEEHNFNATSLHTLVQMVAGKMGTTLVPQMALKQLVSQSAELKAIHLNEKGPHRSIAFVVRPNFTALDSITALMAIFKEQLALEN